MNNALNTHWLIESHFPEVNELFSQEVKNRLYKEIFINYKNTEEIFVQYFDAYQEVLKYAKLRNFQQWIPISQESVDFYEAQIIFHWNNLKYILFHMMVNLFHHNDYDQALSLIGYIFQITKIEDQKEITLWEDAKITILNKKFESLQEEQRNKIYQIL